MGKKRVSIRLLLVFLLVLWFFYIRESLAMADFAIPTLLFKYYVKILTLPIVLGLHLHLFSDGPQSRLTLFREDQTFHPRVR